MLPAPTGSIQLGHVFWPPPHQWLWCACSSPLLLSLNLLCSLYSCPFCSWGVLWDLDSDHLPVLLLVSLYPAYCSGRHPPSFSFWRAHWDGFASCFGPCCPSADRCLSLSLSSAAALFASLPLSAAGSSIPFGRIESHPGAWWSAGLLLPLAKVVGTAGLASPLLDAPLQLTRSSLLPGSVRSLLHSVTGSLPRLHLLLASPTVLLRGVGFSLCRLPGIPFSVSRPGAL